MPEKSIFEKLQVKPGRSLLVINPPREFVAKAGAMPEAAELFLEKQPAFIVTAFLRSMQEFLALLSEIDPLLRPAGIFWVAYPKLTSKLKGDVNRDTLNAAAQQRGWTGVAMISLDDDWSALRLKRL
jgi:hypothetical protein